MVKSEMLGLWALLVVITEVTCHYTSQWAAHIEGGPAVARKIADAQGFTLLAEIFPDTYHLEHRKVAKRSAERNREHHENLTSDKRVKWAQQQRARRRRKRDFLTKKDLGLGEEHIYANDARWKQMWYLNRGYGLDMSVEGAWKQGITGKGIVVTILDDGLEKDHPDLKENYDPQASYDVNGHDDDPMPRYDLIDSNRHGTRCAGEVAAVANNSICSLGIAFKASVGGVRMLDGDVTDAVEARSLSLNPQHIDIYSASWGPDDDGKTVDGPGELAMRAFVEGVTKGRGGRGSIFVWASGNGGRDHDNCNCDGYTNSIWTLSISSATEEGYVPWYSEACSSTLATTYSSGSAGEKQIVTTDLHHTCTSSHTGTSASAPLAAGICALALEANTLLTWRDMQHIVVATAKPANLKASDWVTNGVGRNVSHSFGYGLMDATAMVKLAHIWHTVPQQQKCEVTAPHADKVIPAKSHVTLQLLVTECAGVNYLEHVQAKITLMSQRRGDIQIQLTSPAGTKTTLLARRPHDVSRSGFRSWPFMSVHTWGENPIGIWTLEIHNEARYLECVVDSLEFCLGRATLQVWSLMFYGTHEVPLSHNGVYAPPATPSLPQPNPPPPPPPPPPSLLNLPVSPKKTKPRKNKSTQKPKGGKWKNNAGTNSSVFGSSRIKTSRPSVIQARRPTVATTPPRPVPTFLPALPPRPMKNPPLSGGGSSLTILMAPARKSSPNIPAIFQQYNKVQQLFPYSKINESPLRPSRKGQDEGDLLKESAQLSEWNLIFYGTETPAGVESESSVDTASVSGSGVGKPPLSTLDGSSHNFDNSVDPSAPSSNNNRWKEVTQRNGGAVDGGGAGGGGGISSSVGQQHNIIPDDGFSLSSPVAGVSGASPSGCRTSTRTCLECNPGHYLWHGSCEDVCPAGSFRVDTRCEPCHYSCRFCLGPNDYECTECHTDAALYESSDTGETFCLPKSTLPSLDYTKWLYRSFWALLVNVSLLVTAAGLFYFRQRGCRCRYPGVSGKTIESSVRYNLTADCMSDSE